MMRSLAWYGLAILLVVLYVNTFVFWGMLQAGFGEAAAMVPWLLAGVMALGVMALWRLGPRRAAMSPVLLGVALLAALAGLALADPDFPAKRIHVPQYAVLAAVVWAALKPYIAAERLVVATLLIGALFGVHDEFLQGLHPARTFGLRDMVVNLCGVFAGALVLAGLTGRPVATSRTFRVPVPLIAGSVVAVAGFGLSLHAMAGLPVRPLPYWPTLPLLAGGFALACALARSDIEPDIRHAGTVVLQVLPLSVYPVIANVSPLHFA